MKSLRKILCLFLLSESVVFTSSLPELKKQLSGTIAELGQTCQQDSRKWMKECFAAFQQECSLDGLANVDTCCNAHQEINIQFDEIQDRLQKILQARCDSKENSFSKLNDEDTSYIQKYYNYIHDMRELSDKIVDTAIYLEGESVLSEVSQLENDIKAFQRQIEQDYEAAEHESLKDQRKHAKENRMLREM